METDLAIADTPEDMGVVGLADTSCTVDDKTMESTELVEGAGITFDGQSITINYVDECEKRKADDLGEECDGMVPEKRQCIETVSSDIFSPMEALVTIAGDRQVTEFTPSPSPSVTCAELDRRLSGLVASCSSNSPMQPGLATTSQLQRQVSPSSEASQHVNQAWFTTKEDKSTLQGKGVKWRQGMWSREEIDILKENIAQYCKENQIADPGEVIFEMTKDERKDFYRTVARGIKRPLFAIYRRVLRMYDSRNYMGKYTAEEVEMLKQLREKYGSDWTAIGAAMGRSASSVKDRCRLMKENCSSGKWTDEEENLLTMAVHELSGTQPGESVTSGISWAAVSKVVGTRSEKQCRAKWLNYLNWKETGGRDWTKQDDIELINKIGAMGCLEENEISWNALSAGWPSARSPQWLRSKWWAMKKHVPANAGLSFNEMIEFLRTNYCENLRNKLDKRESRYRHIGTRMDQLPGMVSLQHQVQLQNMGTTVCLQPTSCITQTVTVSSDGIVTQDGELNQGTLGNTFEVVQVSALSGHDALPGQNQQAPYIIHTVPMSMSGGGPTYVLQQTGTDSTGKVTVSAQEIAVSGAQSQAGDEKTLLPGTVISQHQVQTIPLPTVLTDGLTTGSPVTTEIPENITSESQVTQAILMAGVAGQVGLSSSDIIQQADSAGHHDVNVPGTEFAQEELVHTSEQATIMNQLDSGAMGDAVMHQTVGRSPQDGQDVDHLTDQAVVTESLISGAVSAQSVLDSHFSPSNDDYSVSVSQTECIIENMTHSEISSSVLELSAPQTVIQHAMHEDNALVTSLAGAVDAHVDSLKMDSDSSQGIGCELLGSGAMDRNDGLGEHSIDQTAVQFQN